MQSREVWRRRHPRPTATTRPRMEYATAYSLASASARDRPMHRDLRQSSSRGPFLPSGLNSAHRRCLAFDNGGTSDSRDASHPLTTRIRRVEGAMDDLEGCAAHARSSPGAPDSPCPVLPRVHAAALSSGRRGSSSRSQPSRSHSNSPQRSWSLASRSRVDHQRETHTSVFGTHDARRQQAGFSEPPPLLEFKYMRLLR